MNKLRIFVGQSVLKYPNLKEEINDLYQLCLDEIENGESEANEIELCYSSINDLIDENK